MLPTFLTIIKTVYDAIIYDSVIVVEDADEIFIRLGTYV
jgi:hypothetical protein